MSHEGVRQRTPRWASLTIAALVFVGVALMSYPSTASWFFALRESRIISAHVESIDRLDQLEVENALRSAEEYNAHLDHGLIVDPFSEGAERVRLDDAAQRYLRELNMPPGSPMSSISIPRIKTELTVTHGTTDAVLRRGAGHLYGASLPVGGANTHTVITAHSGIPGATLFTHLSELREGDEFVISTLGRALTYEVREVATVIPSDIEALAPVPGADLATLVTCTPTGVNSHRLLVTGARVSDAPPSATPGSVGPGFPWWSLGLTAAGGVCAAMAFTRSKGNASDTL